MLDVPRVAVRGCARTIRLAAAVALVLAVARPLAAAPNPFDGSWQAALVVNGTRCGVQLVMATGQRYSETIRCGGYMTYQAGTYTFANGTIFRTVRDWQPRQRYVLDSGYGGHYEPNAKPPGGSFRVAFPSPSTMVWRDTNFGGAITYQRVR